MYGSLTDLSIWFEGAKQQPSLGSDAAFARSEDWDQFVDLLNAGMFPALRDLMIVCGTVKLVDQTNPCRATIGCVQLMLSHWTDDWCLPVARMAANCLTCSTLADEA